MIINFLNSWISIGRKKVDKSPEKKIGSDNQDEKEGEQPPDEPIDNDLLNGWADNEEYRRILRSLLEQNNEEHRLLRSVLEQISQDKLQLQSQLLESLQSNISQLQRELQEVKKERSQLQSYLSQLRATLDEEKKARSQLEYKIEEIQDQISSLSQDSTTLKPENSSDENVKSEETETPSPSPGSQSAEVESPKTTVALNLDSQEKDLVKTYNKNPTYLSGYPTEVSETEESIEERRLGKSQAAVFEKVRNGTYWIVTVQDRRYLVPKGGMKFNQNNYQTAQSLFEFQGYQPGVSIDFQLLKPGKVSVVPSGDKWELVERGVLQF